MTTWISITEIAGCHSEMPSFAAQLRLFMVIHLFRINVAFKCIMFYTSSYSSKVNYLSDVLAPDKGANKIGKILKTIMSVFIFSLSFTL